MHEAEKLNLDQIQAFLKASEGIRFEGERRQPVYHWIEQVLRQQQYAQQGRAARGLLRRYLSDLDGNRTRPNDADAFNSEARTRCARRSVRASKSQTLGQHGSANGNALPMVKPSHAKATQPGSQQSERTRANLPRVTSLSY